MHMQQELPQFVGLEIEFLEADGTIQQVFRSETSGRYVFKHEMELLLQVAGFERWEIHGNFEGRPLNQENDAMVVSAWKAQ